MSSPRRPLALTLRGRVLAAAAIVLVVLAYAAANVVFQLAGILLAALVVGALVLVRVRRPRLVVARTFAPPLVAAGSALVVTVDVRNRATSASLPSTWRDRVPFGARATPDAPLPSLAAVQSAASGRGGATAVQYTIWPPRRGVLEIGQFEVAVDDPFGIARGTSVVPGTQRVVVVPGLVELVDQGLGVSASEGTARLVQRAVLGNDDDLMTREYRRGDALRRVHWRVSARQGELMVRQEEQRSRPDVRLVVDTRRDGYADAATGYVADGEIESDTFEWVVRMTASLGVHLRQSGYSVTVLESGEPRIDALGTAGTPDEAFLASLAVIRLADPRRPRRAPDAGGPVFAVLADPADETLDWVVALRRSRERAVAFLPVWAVNARERLLAAGWRVVLFRPDDDLAAVWAAVGAADGAAGGGA